MAHHLRKVTFSAAILMVLLLGTLLTFGFRQYQLLSRHEQIVNQSEKVLFQFATIREQITSTLLEQRYRQLPAIVPEVEELHGKINQIVKNAHIPDEYKLSFINQIDLPNLILLLYKGSDPEQTGEIIPKLNQETRQLANRLMLFDRLLVNYAKRRVITFQSLLIGILALSIFLIVNLLVIGHRRLATPIMELAGQVRQIHQGERTDLAITSPGSAREVTELASAFQDMLSLRHQGDLDQGRHNRVLYALHRAGISCRQAPSRETLFQSVSHALLFNEDYFLVWIGLGDTDAETVTPTTIAGSASMSNDECEKCLAVLLEAVDGQNPQNNPTLLARTTGKPAIATDILADTPPVMLKNTMLTDGYAACAALPLQWQRKIYGVLCLYTLNPETFAEKEIELLAGLAGSMGLALHVFDEERELSNEQERTKTLLAALDSPLITCSPKGEILSANETFAQLIGMPVDQITGRHWLAILQPASIHQGNEKEGGETLAKLAADNRDTELIVRNSKDKRHLHARISAIHDKDGAIREFACIGKGVPHHGSEDNGFGQQCQTVISELSAGVAHEISDLSNGIINYAQVLTDNESSRPEDEEDKKILGKIITGGERIAEIVHKLIFYGQRKHAGGEYLPLSTVLDDAVMLIKHHLKTEGIQLDLDLSAKPQTVPVHAQIMQQVLINLFNHRRHALNRKYEGRSADKRLSVASGNFNEGSNRFFRISFMDCGQDLTVEDLNLFATNGSNHAEPGRSLKELIRCRELIESQSGSLKLHNNPDNDSLTIQMDFPLKG